MFRYIYKYFLFFIIALIFYIIFQSNTEYFQLKCYFINFEQDYKCLKGEYDYFISFRLLEKHYEHSINANKTTLTYLHSSKYNFTHIKSYVWHNIYPTLLHSDVKKRPRVKCLNYIGIPVSKQWFPNGHLYPIQIAQYGLSSYSKFLTLSKANTFPVFLFPKAITSKLFIIDLKQQSISKPIIRIEFKPKFNQDTDSSPLSYQLRFEFGHETSLPGYIQSITYKFDYQSAKYPNVDPICFGSDFHEGPYMKIIIRSKTSFTFQRDIFHDLRKAYGQSVPWINKLAIKQVHLLNMENLIISNMSWLDADYFGDFMRATNYFLDTQDSKGGWSIQIERRGSLYIPPGWYSAMGQGTIMSLLVRAYHYSHDSTYLDCALRALHIMNITSSQGGVKTYFLNQFVWLEEYPTSPSSFVLNGFMFSLLGIYDLRQALSLHINAAQQGKMPVELLKYYQHRLLDMDNFIANLKESLYTMLPLYDTGVGTLYDLRHFTLKSPPNRARWDYHVVHIQLLEIMSIIFEEKYFDATAQRWSNYMIGIFSRHN